MAYQMAAAITTRANKTKTRRVFLYVAVLLCALPVCAQSGPVSPQVPTRSLLSEMDQAEQGTEAYIHTQFATGTGFLLHDQGEIVAARHNVLTPAGEIAPEIGVGVPEPPLNNIMEARSVAVAQDPVHDLVLLRITGQGVLAAPAFGMHGAASSRREAVAIPPCEPLPLAQEAQPHQTPHVRHARRTRRTSPVQSTASSRTRARLRIVWDGPLVSSR